MALNPSSKAIMRSIKLELRGFKNGSVVMSREVVQGFKTIWGNACQHSITHLAELSEDLLMDSNQTIWGHLGT